MAHWIRKKLTSNITNHIWGFFGVNSLQKSHLFVGLIVLSSFFVVPETFAQGVPSLGVNASAGQSSLQGFGQFASVFINIFTFLALLILSLVGDLMGTEFITGPEALEALTPIWIYVRNLVNISAVLMIVYLSFSNLFSNLIGEGGGGTWAWQIKDKLPRIIFMLVAVNFSLLGFKLAIDAIQIGSITILSVADTQLESNSAESIDRILTGNKWRRVMKDSNEVKAEQMPDPTNQGQTIDKYAEWNRDIKTNGYIDKLEGKSCEDALKDNTLSATDIENGKKLWTQARYFNEESRTYEQDLESVLVCGSFNEQINSTFCPDGTGDDDCFFRIKSDFSFRNQQVKPGNKTAQNLFMAFGVMFMRIEQLPSLAANIDNIFQVIDNTLFSAIMAIMYVISLAALFFVLIARILILWLAIAFSPVVIGISIMGINTPGGGLTEKVVTHMIVPLKIAAAFAISFVMMSSMIDFKPADRLGMFEFGPSLSAIAVDEYAIMWQIATIIIFWRAAKWALEGTEADAIVKGIFDSATTVGEYALKAATIENQIFTIKDGKGVKRPLSLQGLLDAPQEIARRRLGALKGADSTFYSSFVDDVGFKEDSRQYQALAANDRKEYAEQTKDFVKRSTLTEINQNRVQFFKELKEKANQSNQVNQSEINAAIKEFTGNQFADGITEQEMADFLNKIAGKTVYTKKDFGSYTDESGSKKSDIKIKYESNINTAKADAKKQTKIRLDGTTKADGTELADTEKDLTFKLNEIQNDGATGDDFSKLKTTIKKITGEESDSGTNNTAAKEVFERIKKGDDPVTIWDDFLKSQTGLDEEVKDILKIILLDLKQVTLDTNNDKKIGEGDTDKAEAIKTIETFSKALESDISYDKAKTETTDNGIGSNSN